jgi:hypothetical protein
MAMHGTFEEVMQKLFDLYMEDRMDSTGAEYFLMHLKHPNGELCFGVEDVVRLLEMLETAKTEGE